MIVAKGTFAVPSLINAGPERRDDQNSPLTRFRSEDDLKNQDPPHIQRNFTQLVHSKLLPQCGGQHLQNLATWYGKSLKRRVCKYSPLWS